MVILVIGGTGTVGKPSVEALLKAGAKVRVLSRSKDAVFKAFGDAVEAAEGDYSAISNPVVVAGVDKVLLITLSSQDQPKIEGDIAVTLKKLGVSHLVKVSVYGAAPHEPTGSLFNWHYAAEKNIRKSGIPFTFLRPNLFMQNLLRDAAGPISAQNTFYTPAGLDTHISHIDVRDIADVAAKVLTTTGHEGLTYNLTGPEDLTYIEVAQRFSSALGRQITATPASDAQFHKTLSGAGLPPCVVHMLVDLYQFYRRGGGSTVSGWTEILLGRPARSLEQFVKDNASAFAQKH
jgi:uncharacterized protein YbjT (DUF2867 family)